MHSVCSDLSGLTEKASYRSVDSLCLLPSLDAEWVWLLCLISNQITFSASSVWFVGHSRQILLERWNVRQWSLQGGSHHLAGTWKRSAISLTGLHCLLISQCHKQTFLHAYRVMVAFICFGSYLNSLPLGELLIQIIVSYFLATLV